MFIELLLLSYAGILAHYLFKLKAAADKGQLDDLFTRKSIVKDIITGATTLLCATLIVYVREDISTIFVVTPVGAVIVGYSAQDVFNKIMGAKTPPVLKDKTNE